MTTHQTAALVLRTVDYGDHHVIVHLLGKSTGRISAIAFGARSSKRRFAGALQPLRVVEATVIARRGGDLMRLEELDVLEDFAGLDKRIETLSAAGYGTELVRETWREGEDSEPIFALLKKFYAHLPRCPTSLAVARLVHQFEYHLLELYGLAPAIYRCGRCGADAGSMDKLRFGRQGQGLICGACRQGGDAIGVVTPAALAVLHHLHDPDQPLPTHQVEAALAQAGRVLTNAVDQLVDRPLASRQLLQQML